MRGTLLLLLTFASAQPAFSCFCSGFPFSIQFERSEVAFVGKVTRDTGPGWGTRRAVVAVEQVFRGLSDQAREIEVDAMAGTSCHRQMSVGETWLVFAHRIGDGSVVGIPMCSESGRLGEDDVRLRAIRQMLSESPLGLVGQLDPAIQGVPVTARSRDQIRTVTTLANGQFEFPNIGPGFWTLTIDTPELVLEYPPARAGGGVFVTIRVRPVSP